MEVVNSTPAQNVKTFKLLLLTSRGGILAHIVPVLHFVLLSASATEDDKMTALMGLTHNITKSGATPARMHTQHLRPQPLGHT